jgi:hypothetical protein
MLISLRLYLCVPSRKLTHNQSYFSKLNWRLAVSFTKLMIAYPKATRSEPKKWILWILVQKRVERTRYKIGEGRVSLYIGTQFPGKDLV